MEIFQYEVKICDNHGVIGETTDLFIWERGVNEYGGAGRNASFCTLPIHQVRENKQLYKI